MRGSTLVLGSLIGLALAAAGIVSVARQAADPPLTVPDTFLFGVWDAPATAYLYGGSGLAVDCDGNVYVADPAGRRVQVFDAEGQFVRAWGGPGTGEGRLGGPADIAVDCAGSAWVLDGTRVSRFDRTGRHQVSWHLDAEAAYPQAIALARDASVLVLSWWSLDHYAANGMLIRRWAFDKWDAATHVPRDLTVGSDGTIFVAFDRSPMLRIDATGTSLGPWEPEAICDAHGCDVLGLAADGAAGLYVTSTGADGLEVRHIDADGQLLARWAIDSPPRGSRMAIRFLVAVGPAGTVLSLNRYLGLIEQRRADEGSLVRRIGSTERGQQRQWPARIASVLDAYGIPSAIAVAPDGRFCVLDKFSESVRCFDGRGALEFVTEEAAGSSYGWESHAGLAMAADGSVFVATPGQVRRFDRAGRLVASWGHFGDGDAAIDYPQGLDVAADGTLFLADRGRIKHFAADGTSLGGWAGADAPTGLRVTPNGEVYATSSVARRVTVYDLSGQVLRQWRTDTDDPAQGMGPHSNPMGIEVAPNGLVYVAEQDKHRVDVYTSEGVRVTSLGGQGSGVGGFWMPEDVAVGPAGRLYVANWSWPGIQVFTAELPDHWRAEFHANPWLAESPIAIQEPVELHLDWGVGAPAAGLPEDGWSAQFRRPLEFNAGRIVFRLTAAGGARLWLDDRLLMDGWEDVAIDRNVEVDLTAGRHQLVLEYRDPGGRASVELDWRSAPDRPALFLPLARRD